jgi:hypothetical protein
LNSITFISPTFFDKSITIAAVFPPLSIKELQTINLAPAKKSAGAFFMERGAYDKPPASTAARTA